jgi:pimeloyl-ACP methyl ester carboxylesterase
MQIRVRDLDVWYRDLGSGRPLICLHGWSLDHRAMEESLEPVLAKRRGWRRIYLDLPGHGATPGPDWICSHDDMLQFVGEFVDAVIPGERFTLAGLSYGGELARGIVHRRASQIDGLMIVVSATRHANSLPRHRVRHRDAAFLAGLRSGEEQHPDFVVWQSIDVLERVRERFDAAAREADRGFLKRLGWGGSFSFDIDPPPAPYEAPALFVAGRFDHWCGYRGMFDLLDLYPLATYAVLDGAGHGLTVERPDLYEALVADWLDRVDDASPH